VSAVNPYAPPQAAVADVHERGRETVQPVRTFSSAGRIGRLRFLAHSIAAYLLVVVAAGVVGGLTGALGLAAVVPLLVGLVFIVYLIFIIMKTIQRSHDMGWSGWTALLALIPLVGLVWIFKSGTDGHNEYGAPPPPNGVGVWLTAVGLPVLLGVLMVAVAVPAYDSYVKRAKEAQRLQQQK
jgi:uncharacterized membrane protein YhaH (DUF805 family)